MSCGPQCFDRNTSMLVPAVFAVLMKMNLYLWDRIITHIGNAWNAFGVVFGSLPKTDASASWLRTRRCVPQTRATESCTINSPTRTDDLFSETFFVRSHSKNGR